LVERAHPRKKGGSGDPYALLAVEIEREITTLERRVKREKAHDCSVRPFLLSRAAPRYTSRGGAKKKDH